MTDEIKAFNKLLIDKRDEINLEYEELISQMQSYDVSSFNSELHSEYNHYSEKYFDETKFEETVLRAFHIDLTNSIIKEKTFDAIRDYSEALIHLKTLQGYIKYNNILIGEEDDE
jgi:hypothetical protein